MSPADGRKGSAAAVVAELSRFQTPDGGFGRGLEPDLRSSSPTAIATSVAFQLLRDVAADAGLPIVRNGIDYLRRTLDRERWVWPAVTDEIDDDAHAPWWNVEGIAARSEGFVFNP